MDAIRKAQLGYGEQRKRRRNYIDPSAPAAGGRPLHSSWEMDCDALAAYTKFSINILHAMRYLDFGIWRTFLSHCTILISELRSYARQLRLFRLMIIIWLSVRIVYISALRKTLLLLKCFHSYNAVGLCLFTPSSCGFLRLASRIFHPTALYIVNIIQDAAENRTVHFTVACLEFLTKPKP